MESAIENDAELEAQFQVYLAGQKAAMSGNTSTSSPKQATTAASPVQPTPINAQAHSPPLHSVTDGSSPEEDKVLLAQQQTLAEAADAVGVKINDLPALTNNDQNDAELEAEFQVYLAGQKAYTTSSPKRATTGASPVQPVPAAAAPPRQVNLNTQTNRVPSPVTPPSDAQAPNMPVGSHKSAASHSSSPVRPPAAGVAHPRCLLRDIC